MLTTCTSAVCVAAVALLLPTVVVGFHTETTSAPTPTPSGPPPALPFQTFASWAVVTTNSQHGVNGTVNIDWSVGQHLNVDINEKLVCVYAAQELYPLVPSYTATALENFTAGYGTTHLVHTDGDTSNCSSARLEGKIQSAGGWLWGPLDDDLPEFKFLEFTTVNELNASVWQRMETLGSDGSYRIFTWTISLGSHIPQVYVNLTHDASANLTTILTTAYNGYYETQGGVNSACLSTDVCGIDVCVANPNASTATIQGAVHWVCGVESCHDINSGSRQYPDTALAHGTWAFNEYYQKYKSSQGSSACAFGGAGEVVSCSTACTTCNVSSAATHKEVASALEWACGKDGIQDCSPIQPGGSHFHPNTTVAHANWAFNKYYQAYKCIPDYESCDFSGVGVIIPC